jgi:AraC-like DNA-binding protein
MRLAALLPSCCKSEIAVVLAGHTLVEVDSWADVTALAGDGFIAGVLADPTVDRARGVQDAAEFLRSHTRTPTIGFFSLSASNLRSALLLARQGLWEAYTYPLGVKREMLKRVVDSLASPPCLSRFLALVEPSFGELPPLTASVVQDVFNRPHRYGSTLDLVTECRASVRQLYRNLAAANLSSPKKLLMAAKVLRGIHYVCDMDLSVQGTSEKLGYTNAQAFARHTTEVLGLPPSKLRAHGCADDTAFEVVEWLFKPSKAVQRTLQRKFS